ncbi:DUF7288 family protein [Halomicrobium salinisoli]|uniref:DUF7288 family protein n=1 Tax=Halomicrobium salinisoli TaxID=2878391 RepID=UPI003B82E564
MEGDRGQAHTLEAIVAGLLLLSSVVYALQMTAVTPLSASTSSQHIENQQSSVARGVLAAAAERDALKPTLLYWHNDSGDFHGAPETGYYTSGPPNTTFGGMLERAFDDAAIAYNVDLRYRTADGDVARKPMIHRGVPSDNAVRSARVVTLTDDDRLVDPDGSRNMTVAESSTFYADNLNGTVYNVVRVEVVAWRI